MIRTALAAAAVAATLVPAAQAAKPRADLTISRAASSAKSVAPGGQLTATFTIKNGGKAAAGKSTIEFALSTDAKLDARDIRLGSVAQKAIKARKTATGTLKATVPASAAARRYSLLVCADTKSKVKESKETNNCRTAAAIDVAAAPAAGGTTPAPPAGPVTLPSNPAPAPQPTLPTATPTPAPFTTILTEAPQDVSPLQSARFAFTANEAVTGFECRLDDAAFAPCTSPHQIPSILAGEHAFEVRARRDAVLALPANKAWRIEFEAPAVGPADAPAAAPETQATTSDAGEMTLVSDTTEFLYTGNNPIQKDVEPDAIEESRAAVLRGKVLRRNGSPVDGVRVTVVDHPELGRTATRTDGGFEIAVNGGGAVTLAFEREGYVPSQRQLEVPTQEYEAVQEIVLVPYEDRVSGVDLTDDELQVARGSAITDDDGTRRATLLLEPGTEATATLPDGTEKELGDRLNIRATEFTIGANGPAAMPGELPPTSAYTYAVEYSIDEAARDEAVNVEFDKPVVTYVDNIVGFKAGTPVPMGYYDREKAQWIAAPDGIVIKILAESNGRAQLDVTGDDVADTQLASLGIDDAELAKLADLYAPGKSLWRAAITHFTPWDYNWPYGLPDGAGGPDQGGPDDGDPDGDDPCPQGGSIIICEDQALGEQAAIAGTPYRLVYQSDRVPGRRTSDVLEIPLTGANPPASVARIDLTIEVAGRTITRSFNRAPNQRSEFVFDGLDAYGRAVQGEQKVDVRIDYVYPAVYRSPGSFSSSFAAIGGAVLSANRTRQEINVSQNWSGVVGGLTVPPAALAGWSVDVHHTYDPIGRTLYMGDGTKRSAEGQNFDVISTTKSQLAFPEGLATTPEGDVYVADSSAHVVRRIAPNGASTVIAGTGTAGFGGDGGAATAAKLDHPSDVALAPDGTVVIADEGNNRIRRIGLDGRMTTLAGTGEGGYEGDGGAATSALLDEPSDIAVDAGGAAYVIDRANHVVRRIGPDGIISTLAGNGSPGFGGDGGVATRARLRSPRDVAVRETDGSVFVADGGNHRVRRIDPDGTIETVAGNGSDAYAGDGGRAVDASLDTPSAILPLRDGGVLLADAGHAVLRKLSSDGTIATVAGNGTPGFRGDGAPAAQARLDFPQSIALGADDTVYVADAGNDRVRELAPSLPGLSLGEFSIASLDGGALYVFDRSGRHLRTVDALTRAVVLRFRYDTRGRLSEIENGDGLKTTIQRDAAGTPTAIVGHHNQLTSLQVTGGYLSRIANEAGDRTLLEYNAGGLLTKLTDPRDGVHSFEYDAFGRLTRDVAADGSAQTLSRSVSGNATVVTHRTGENRTTTYRVERTADGSIRRSVTNGAGQATVTLTGNDGVTTVTKPDGTRATTEIGPDPRFGMQAPVITKLTITTPGGVRSTLEGSRTADLADPDNVLSLTSLTETATTNGRTSTTRFDYATKRFTVSSPSGRTVTTEIDGLGRTLRVDAPGTLPTINTYDPRGRLIRTGTGARFEAYTYDARGRIATTTDALSRTTEFTYDLADRATSLRRPDGRVVSYSHDRAGNLLSLTPPGRAAHTFAYSSRDVVDRYTPPSGAAAVFGADRDNLRTTVTKPGGVGVTFAYDAASRVDRITQPGRATQFNYAAGSGQLTSVAAGAEQISYGYDGGLPTRSTVAGSVAGEVTATYDSDLRLATESVNGASTVANEWDADGLLTRAGAVTVTRGADDGRVTGVAIGSNATTITRSTLGEPDSVATKQGSAPIYSETYGRDNAGRITGRSAARTGGANAFVYAYDAADRLSQVTRDGAVQATYSYDDNGNRTQVVRTGQLPVTASYDAQDRMTQYGAYTYTYTDAGELRTKVAPDGTTTYDYDALGALTKVTLPGKVVEYAIDPAGRRVAVKHDGVFKHAYLYAGGPAPVAELNADGSVLSRFVYATRRHVPDALIRGGKTYRIVTDHLGSPRSVVDTTNGAVVQELDYDEFGLLTRDTNPGYQPFGFAGGLYDADTKLVRFGARDYDAETGRFTTKDPLNFSGGDTNLYAYAASDPINLVDPSGLLFDTLLDIGFIAYDLFDIGRSMMNGCGVSGSQWASLGADVAGALIPFATGGGMAVRAANRLDDASDARKIVIGEDMAGRVIPEAKRHGADYYDPPDMPPDQWMDANRKWINDRMDEGCTIINCGPAPGRANYPDPTSPYYQMELDEIGRRNYPMTPSDRYGK